MIKTSGLLLTGLAAVALAGCGGETSSNETTPAETASPTNAELIEAVLAGDHRSDAERARDQHRNPKETLLFFGVEPDMTVVEIWPGGGWYTQVIAPYLNADGGTYYAAGFPLDSDSERVQAALAAFRENYVDKPELYGDINLTELAVDSELAPAGTADAVLTFRNVHNWIGRGTAEGLFAGFYKALKPGGVLGVVEHRADGAPTDGDGTDFVYEDGSAGYVSEADVIALAAAAGFELAGRSEINANPADTKNHPFGVWTLPPVKRSSAVRGQEDPDFDRSAYDAIGESDRMTLKFVKPLVVDGALLE